MNGSSSIQPSDTNRANRSYRVKFKGFENENDLGWKAERDLSGAKDMVEEYCKTAGIELPKWGKKRGGPREKEQREEQREEKGEGSGLRVVEEECR